MSQKKYASLSTLQTFLDNLRTTFANLSHKHTLSDLTDYKVDTALSSTSTNPVQNAVLNAEFDEIAVSMQALDLALDGKSDSTHNHDEDYSKIGHNHDGVYAPSSHTHTIANVTNLQSSLDAKVPNTRTVNGKALSSNITLSASDVSAYTKTEIDNMEFITTSDIDSICGGSIVAASEVTF